MKQGWWADVRMIEIKVPAMKWHFFLQIIFSVVFQNIIDIISARSPVYSHLSSTLVGLPVIRAFKMQSNCINDFYSYQDNQSSPWLLFLAAQRWFGVRLDWTIAIYFIGYLLAAFFTPQSGNIKKLKSWLQFTLLDIFWLPFSLHN